MLRKKTRAQFDLEEAQGLRRLRRHLFPDLVAAFWPSAPPAVSHRSGPRCCCWSQLIADSDERPLAALGENADGPARS